MDSDECNDVCAKRTKNQLRRSTSGIFETLSLGPALCAFALLFSILMLILLLSFLVLLILVTRYLSPESTQVMIPNHHLRRGPRRIGSLPAAAAEASDSNTEEFDRKDTAYYPQDQRDIYHVDFLLRQVLVPDLVPTILDLAGYWLKSTTARAQRVAINSRSAGFVYLKSHEIASDLPHPVRRVEFTVTSRDQGWSDQEQHHGTYVNSWTWIDAGVSRETKQEDGTVSRTIVNKREVCRNVNAGKQDKTHTVVFSHDAEDEEEHEWIRNLKTGDSIAVAVEARYPGWTNNVHSCDISVFTAGAIR